MLRKQHFIGSALCGVAFMTAVGLAFAGSDADDSGYCMEVEMGPFHMLPGFTSEEGACAVRDYWDGEFQDAFYPFTKEDHRFNCEVFGDFAPLPIGDVPSSVISEGMISGTIDGHPFSATLFCASLTNWYQDSCMDPDDPATCSVQLAQPFLQMGLPFPRVTEVSVFDGVITVERGKKGKAFEVPLVIATRAAGITHLESLDPPQVGASVTHSLLGMVTYARGKGTKVLDGSLDLLLQGHIFFPAPVADDPAAARIKGSICSRDLYQLLNAGERGEHQH